VWRCLCDPTFNRFSRTVTYDRQTGRQTDRQTDSWLRHKLIPRKCGRRTVRTVHSDVTFRVLRTCMLFLPQCLMKAS